MDTDTERLRQKAEAMLEQLRTAPQPKPDRDALIAFFREIEIAMQVFVEYLETGDNSPTATRVMDAIDRISAAAGYPR